MSDDAAISVLHDALTQLEAAYQALSRLSDGDPTSEYHRIAISIRTVERSVWFEHHELVQARKPRRFPTMSPAVEEMVAGVFPEDVEGYQQRVRDLGDELREARGR